MVWLPVSHSRKSRLRNFGSSSTASGRIIRSHELPSRYSFQGRGPPNRNKLAGVVSVGGALHERFGESVFANSRQLSKALVRRRLGPSREAQPSDLLRGQISTHRQHCQELLIAVLKPIATERLAELR